MYILLLKIIITAYFCLRDQQTIITISLFYDTAFKNFVLLTNLSTRSTNVKITIIIIMISLVGLIALI